MRNTLCYIVANTVILLSLLVSNSLAAPGQKTGEFADLTLAISTTKTEFIPLEPIPLTITLTNVTSQPIMGHTNINLSSPGMELRIGQDNNMLLFKGDISLVKRAIQPEQQMIASGAQYQSTGLLDINLDKNFPQPGLYKVQLTLHDFVSHQQIVSNILVINIIEPTGLDLQAWEYIKHNSNPSLFFSPFQLSENEQTPTELKEFVSNFRETRYGDYAAFLLGDFYFVKKEYISGVEQLESLVKNPDFIFADYVLSNLVIAHTKLNNLTKAKAYMDALKTQHPSSHFIPVAALSVLQADQQNR